MNTVLKGSFLKKNEIMLSFIVVKCLYERLAFHMIQTDCLWYIFSSFLNFFQFKVLTLLTFLNTAICVALTSRWEQGRLVYSGMVCIFPLVLAAVKRNLESRNTKTWEGNYLSWRRREEW